MINDFRNPHANVIPNQWRFDTNQDWEIHGQAFESFSAAEIANKTLQALGFHIFVIEYLEKGALRFTDVRHAPELIAEPVGDYLGQVVMDSEEEELSKRNKRAAKKRNGSKNIVLLDLLDLPCYLILCTFWLVDLSCCHVLCPLQRLDLLCCLDLCPLLFLVLYLFCYLVLCPLLFLVMHPLKRHVLCPLLFLVLDLLCCLVLYTLLFLVLSFLELDLELFCCLVLCSIIFLVLNCQLFCCCILCSVQPLLIFDLYLSEHSDNLYQMSLGSVYQPALPSAFVYFRLSASTT